MEHLKATLDQLMQQLPDADGFQDRLNELKSVYPFNDYEYIIAHLLSHNILSLDAYLDLRTSYVTRNLNRDYYLHLFKISSPRYFGEGWAQTHLKELVPALKQPSKNKYDFELPPNIRIEVKASRAVKHKVRGPLVDKAISFSSPSAFDMNFQQNKPHYCDVFVWIAVWRDVIKFWVLPSYEVEHNKHYNDKQHSGNKGEGQLHIKHNNITDFEKYLTQPRDLEEAIRSAYIIEQELRRS